MQWLYNASTPDLMNPFKSLHSAGNGAFDVGKDHQWAAKCPSAILGIQLAPAEL